MTRQLVVAPEAEAQIEAIDTWWRENRPASPELFEQELSQAFAFVATAVYAVDAHTLGFANSSTRVLEKSRFEKIGQLNDPDDGVIWHWRRERSAG